MAPVGKAAQGAVARNEKEIAREGAASAVAAFEKVADETQSLRTPWGGRVSPVEASKLIQAATNAVQALGLTEGPTRRGAINGVWGSLARALQHQDMSLEPGLAYAGGKISEGVAVKYWGPDRDIAGKEVPVEPQQALNRVAFTKFEELAKRLTSDK